MADDRLLCCRSPSIAATRADSDIWRSPAISFSALQKSSSRLTLVLWPVMRMERLTTGDFILTLVGYHGSRALQTPWKVAKWRHHAKPRPYRTVERARSPRSTAPRLGAPRMNSNSEVVV